MNENNRLERLYQQTLLSMEKNQMEKMEIQKKISDTKIKATDVHKLSAAIKNITQTIDYEIKTLKSLSVVLDKDE